MLVEFKTGGNINFMIMKEQTLFPEDYFGVESAPGREQSLCLLAFRLKPSTKIFILNAIYYLDVVSADTERNKRNQFVQQSSISAMDLAFSKTRKGMV